MTITLYPLTPADLRALASSAIPDGLAGQVADGALPPAFVAERSLQQLNAGKSAHWCSTFLIARDADHMMVGACGFKDAPVEGRVEIGYGVAPACRGQGIAKAAVLELLRVAFADAEVHQVLAQINPENLASARVVHALGFDACGTVVDNDEPLVQWISRRSTHAGCVPSAAAS